MKKFEEDRKNFNLILKMSYILVLIIIIVAFEFFPSSNSKNEKKFVYTEPLITLVDIPVLKNEISNTKKTVPKIPQQLIEIEEDIFLEELEIKEVSINDKSKTENSSKNGTISIKFLPMQILEVVPENKGYEGSIKVKIKISVTGKAEEHLLVSNSTRSEECLREVIKAIYKSKWKPVTIEGEKISVWIEKSYSFDD